MRDRADGNVVGLAPRQQNLTGLTPDHVLQMAQEADLAEVLVIGRTGTGELYYRAARTGLYQQSRRDLVRLTQAFEDELMMCHMRGRR